MYFSFYSVDAAKRNVRAQCSACCVLLTLMVFNVCAQSDVYLSEFMAENDSSMIDDDDDRSDWIEIHNPTASPIPLGGWYLSDEANNLTKWMFPPVSISAGQFMVVFASEKDRVEPGAPLHTNFRLSGDGEYLALTEPDGLTIRTEFAPAFPTQTPDVSYGRGSPATIDTPLVPVNSPAKAIIPSDGSLGLSWTESGFDDSDWKNGTTGVGYDYGGLVGLDVSEMRNLNPSVYVRTIFQLNGNFGFDRLILRMRFEDGMVAYLNGEEIARENAPDVSAWNSGAPDPRDDSFAVVPSDIDISSAIDLLQEGENVLAFHGLNFLVGSSDFLLLPELLGISNVDGEITEGFFFNPTPGEINDDAAADVTSKPVFSVQGGSFTQSFDLALSLPVDAAPDAEIRYTTDGSVPTLASTRYQEPIQILSTTRVRARVFEPAGNQSGIEAETYIGVTPSVESFSSNLPLVVLDNFGGGGIPDRIWQNGVMAVFEPGDTRSLLTAQPTLITGIGFKQRGSSTGNRDKASLSIEARDDEDQDRNIEILGMPAESDWVLWGPYNFDRSLMHNPLIYELSNQVGRYAVRTRFVEVFLNTGGGSLSSTDYWGVYAIMEKISRDEDRVDVAKLFPEHDREPNISGGYMLKIDRADPGDSGFSGAGQNDLRYVTPKEVEIERPERNAQEAWIRNFFNDFGSALNGPNSTNPELGYARYVDVGAAVDHHLLNVLAFNVDALRLSGYMHVPRGGKLTFGPIWDFDRAMGSTDGRDSNPLVWRSQSGDRGTDFFNYPWWGRMFSDIDFFQKYIDRWWELRGDQFSVENINSIIDRMASELSEAEARNLSRWGQNYRFGNGYQGEVDYLKTWFGRRIGFIDGQFVDPPTFPLPGGRVDEGYELTLSAPEGGQIYYTLNGTDPRLTGGTAEPNIRATLYNGPIVIDRTTVVTARVRNLSHSSLTGANNPPLSSKWSGIAQARFSVDRAPLPGELIVTEIQYNPSAPSAAELALDAAFVNDDFEFLEIKNVSDEPLDLADVRFLEGITFVFAGSAIDILDAGERLLLVKNQAAFTARYGASSRVGGVYSGNLANGGETLTLVNGEDQVLLSFDFKDGWFPITDGLGFSLVLTDEMTSADALSSRDSWQQSASFLGSPGDLDDQPLEFPTVVINEALTNPELPDLDAVELLNLSNISGDIGGWYLTDDRNDPFKYQFPDATLIDASAYLVVDETAFRPAETGGFSFSSQGEEAYLLSADENGQLTGYMHGFPFGAAPAETTFGRHVISTGEEHFVAQLASTLGAPNASPSVGPIVINEIMYNPAPPVSIGGPSLEYVELQNISGDTVALYDLAFPQNTWILAGGIDYAFSNSATLSANGHVLLVGFDPADADALADFMAAYSLTEPVDIFGPFTSQLSNGGETIRLMKPGKPIEATDTAPATLPMIIVDEVKYSDGSPWPDGADGTGMSIQRIAASEYGNDPANWSTAAPNPGRANTVSELLIESVSLSDGVVTIRFQRTEGQTYSVLVRSDLVGGEWVKFKDVEAASQSGPFSVEDPSVSSQSGRYYRLITPAAP